MPKLYSLVFISVIATFPLLAVAAPKPIAGTILVRGISGFSPQNLARLANSNGATVQGEIGKTHVRVMKMDPTLAPKFLEVLKKHRHIEFAEFDASVPPDEMIPNDPLYGQAWHLPKLNLPAAWSTASGKSVVVAVLDTGVQIDHPDLSGRLLSGWNTVLGNTDVSDVFGHGTKVAGSVGATTNNGYQVAGVAFDTQILPVKISTATDGSASYSAIAQGISWATDHGAKIINISYEVSGSSTVISAAQYAVSKGAMVFVSSGNGSINPGYANSPYLMAIGATDSSDVKASWSNYGAYVDVVAPGVSIMTTTMGSGAGGVSGTSFSSPVAAGVAALVKSVNASLTPTDIESILKKTAVDLGAAGRDDSYGNGRLNASAAVSAAQSFVAQSDTTPPSVAISAPTASTVSGLVNVAASATDNVGVAKAELWVANVLVATDLASPYQFSWDSAGVADGNYGLVVKAYDAMGNSASVTKNVSVQNTVTVDSIAPTVQITSPTAGSVVSGTVTIAVSAVDNKSIASVTCYVDGSAIAVTNVAPYKCNWNTRKASAGAHSLTAKAVDAAGNSAISAVVSVSKK